MSKLNYTELHRELRLLFDPVKPEIIMPSGIRITNPQFVSDSPDPVFINPEDPFIRENNVFSYPVFCPKTDSNRVILMLHGLNERSWSKYLVWAYRLAEAISSYVILFPISFHINRSPQSWSNPRTMTDFMGLRNSITGKIFNSSFVNIALSNRLTDDPMRFFNSGYRTVNDIVKLLTSVKEGSHPVLPASQKIDIFSYSIGAFISEIMIMGNPENLFSESRLFIFCGGSVFSNMNGSSKLIMDKRAFDRVYNYYMKDFEDQIQGNGRLPEYLRSSRIGLAFRSMIDFSKLARFRERILLKLRDQINVIGLKQDTVIPVNGTIETLKPTGRNDSVRVMDFGYQYSHENPFPVLNGRLAEEVDRCFDLVFGRAAAFLI